MNDSDTNPKESTIQSPIFDYVSFKVGMYVIIQLGCLYAQRHSFYKRKIGKIPFLIQVMWTVSNSCYTSSFYIQDIEKANAFTTVCQVLDSITKILLVYFLCYRVVLADKIQPMQSIQGHFFKHKWIQRMIWLSLITLGLAVILVSNMTFIAKTYGASVDVGFYGYLYNASDVYISFIELATLLNYVMRIHDLGSFSQVYTFFMQLNRQVKQSCNMAILFAMISLIYLICSIVIVELDPDYTLNAMIAAIKYSYQCDLTVQIFKVSVLQSATHLVTLSSNNEEVVDAKHSSHRL